MEQRRTLSRGARRLVRRRSALVARAASSASAAVSSSQQQPAAASSSSSSSCCRRILSILFSCYSRSETNVLSMVFHKCVNKTKHENKFIKIQKSPTPSKGTRFQNTFRVKFHYSEQQDKQRVGLKRNVSWFIAFHTNNSTNINNSSNTMATANTIHVYNGMLCRSTTMTEGMGADGVTGTTGNCTKLPTH